MRISDWSLDVCSSDLAITTLAERKRADLIADLLLPLPVRMIYEIMGFPKDEARTQEFAARAMRILVGPQRDAEKMRLSMESAFKAAQELYDDTLEIVQQRRANGSVGDRKSTRLNSSH